MRALAPVLAACFLGGCEPADPPPAIEPPCFSTLCEPGGLQLDDDTLVGGVPVATTTDSAVVLAWEDFERVVVATLPFDGALDTASVDVESRGRIAIAASGDEAGVFRSDRERNITFIKDGVATNIFGGDRPAATSFEADFIVSTVAESIHLARVSPDGDVQNLRPTGIEGRNPSIVRYQDELVVVAHDEDGVFAFSADAESLSPTSDKAFLAGVVDTPSAEDTDLAAVALEDGVLVAVASDASSLVTGVFDPIVGSFRGAATTVSEQAQFDRPPGLAVTSGGTIGVCYAPGETLSTEALHGIAFQRLDDTGAPLGAPEVLAENEDCTVGCALTAAGDSFFALWWQCGGGAVENRMLLHAIKAAPEP